MPSHETHQFISSSKEQCVVEQLISSIEIKNIITAVELIRIPTASIAFLNNDDKEHEIIIVIGGSGTITTDKQSDFIKPGEIVSVEANSTRALSNIDEELFQVVSIRYKNKL